MRSLGSDITPPTEQTLVVLAWSSLYMKNAGDCAKFLYFLSSWHADGKEKLERHITLQALYQELDQNHASDILLFGRECIVSQFLFYGASLFSQCCFSTKEHL